MIKSKLCVMWRANKKAWVTRQIFNEWMNEVFGPRVVDEHSEELTTEELQDLHLEVQQTANEEVSLVEEEETWENVPSLEIKNIFFMRSKVQEFVGKNHPKLLQAVSATCNNFG